MFINFIVFIKMIINLKTIFDLSNKFKFLFTKKKSNIKKLNTIINTKNKNKNKNKTNSSINYIKILRIIIIINIPY